MTRPFLVRAYGLFRGARNRLSGRGRRFSFAALRACGKIRQTAPKFADQLTRLLTCWRKYLVDRLRQYSSQDRRRVSVEDLPEWKTEALQDCPALL